MPRTPTDPVVALLERTSLTKSVKHDVWDAFHQTQTTQKLRSRIDRLPLPQAVKRDLWNLKQQHITKKATKQTQSEPSPGAVSAFIAEHFRHFNAATLKDAAEAYKALIDKGGQMFVSMAGAMSTAELGRSLAPMIRAGKVHGICCTGANLEEDLFNLVAHDEYERLPQYDELHPDEEADLYKRHINRVTDTGIPEKAAMTPIEGLVQSRLEATQQRGDRLFPHEILFDIVKGKTLEPQYQGDPQNSWLVAAAEADLPVFVPGWEDSTLGNVFAANVLDGTYPPSLIKSGVEYMVELARWYQTASKDADIGFFQIGGGIAGDFSICVVPLLEQDAKVKGIKKWAYFCQVSDSVTSYGGYSGAAPNEKITWGKLDPETPSFAIESDASIVVPLIFSYVLGW
jgi:deoxyhypusine synthase